MDPASQLPSFLSNRRSLPDRVAKRSFRQALDHGQDAVGAAFQLGVDFGQRARWLEDVEVAVEGDFVADSAARSEEGGVEIEVQPQAVQPTVSGSVRPACIIEFAAGIPYIPAT
jgi:hypothetical protein